MNKPTTIYGIGDPRLKDVRYIGPVTREQKQLDFLLKRQQECCLC